MIKLENSIEKYSKQFKMQTFKKFYYFKVFLINFIYISEKMIK